MNLKFAKTRKRSSQSLVHVFEKSTFLSKEQKVELIQGIKKRRGLSPRQFRLHSQAVYANNIRRKRRGQNPLPLFSPI